MVTLVVSDVHLGYENSNVDQFNSFLGEVVERTDIENFVILGDVVDMWRRDVSGLFLELNEMVQLLVKIKNNKVPIYYIVGNHDYHLLKLEDHKYPFVFQKDLQLEIDGRSYVFKHGWEFDPIQHEETCEELCHNLSDEAGEERSDLWSRITSKPDISKHIDGVIKKSPSIAKKSGALDTESPKIKYMRYVTSPPHERFQHEGLDVRIVEGRAKDSLKKGEVLVFGHTHEPFVTPDKRLINTGSWINEESVFNTYAEIDGKEVRLMQYEKGNITESVTKKV
jgi:UDP-2,3-diacylglucosamine pyrophosphatase LpxH